MMERLIVSRKVLIAMLSLEIIMMTLTKVKGLARAEFIVLNHGFASEMTEITGFAQRCDYLLGY